MILRCSLESLFVLDLKLKYDSNFGFSDVSEFVENPTTSIASCLKLIL